MMATKLELMLEAEKRGILPEDKKSLLFEARSRGLIPKLTADQDPAHTPESRSRLRDIALHIAENVPSVTGGMIGAALGLAAGGPAGAVAGAALGGAAGQAEKKLYDYLNVPGAVDRETATSAAKEIGLAGLGQGVAEGAGQGIIAGLKAGAPKAIELGAQMLKAVQAIPEKYSIPVLKNPAILNRALPMEVVSKGYQAFERYTGLKGLDAMAQEREKAFSAGELDQLVRNVANRIRGGEVIPPQQLYAASQAENQLSRLAKTGNPDAMAMHGSVSLHESGVTVDKALEKVHPEYKNLRTAYSESKDKEAFSHILPQNKNMSPNVLRTWGALGAAGYETREGNPGKAALILGAVSPAVAGAAIRTAPFFAPAIAAASGVAARLGAAAGAQALAGTPASQQPEAPKPSAAGKTWRDYVTQK
jgi:hypothetical protein